MHKKLAEFTQLFSKLSQLGKVEFLTRVAHEETIRVRMAFASGSVIAGEARNSNERIHQLCNYIFQVLEINRYLDDSDMMEDLLAVSEARGEVAIAVLEKLLKTNKNLD